MDNCLNAVVLVFDYMKDGQPHDYRSIGRLVSGSDELNTFGPVPQILNRVVAAGLCSYKRVVGGGPKPLPCFHQAQYHLHSDVTLDEFRQAAMPWLQSSSKS